MTLLDPKACPWSYYVSFQVTRNPKLVFRVETNSFTDAPRMFPDFYGICDERSFGRKVRSNHMSFATLLVRAISYEGCWFHCFHVLIKAFSLDVNGIPPKKLHSHIKELRYWKVKKSMYWKTKKFIYLLTNSRNDSLDTLKIKKFMKAED